MSAPRLFGISVVRDAADLIGINLLHHLAVGFERILVIDNGSTDATATVLQRLAATTAVEWESDSGPFHQGTMMMRLDGRRLRRDNRR